MQGSLRTNFIVYLSQVVGFVGWYCCLCLLSNLLFGIVACVCYWDLLFGVVACACCRICWVISLLALAVGLVGCRCLRLLLGLLGGAGVSAVGTILLQSPGWNEGKARNATLGKHRQKRIELRRSDTFGVSSCWGQGNIALAGLIYVFITNQLLWDCCSDCLRSCRKSLWLATTFLLCVRANL